MLSAAWKGVLHAATCSLRLGLLSAMEGALRLHCAQHVQHAPACRCTAGWARQLHAACCSVAAFHPFTHVLAVHGIWLGVKPAAEPPPPCSLPTIAHLPQAAH